MTTSEEIDLNDALAEFRWLKDNPEFRERPMTLDEFLGPKGLNCAHQVWPGSRFVLQQMMGGDGRISTYRPFAGIEVPDYVGPVQGLFTGGVGIGKALHNDAMVSTPKGWRAMGSLMVGDQVTGSSGRPTTVTGVFPQGERDLYRLTTTDGASVLCDGDHLWEVTNCKAKSRKSPSATRIMTTAQILDSGLRASNNQRKWQIRFPGPVEFEKGEPLPIDPYVLGALIGDGGMSHGGVGFTSADPEIVERMRAETSDYVDWFPTKSGEYGWRLVGKHKRRADGSVIYAGPGSNEMKNRLVSLGLQGTHSYDKFIPEMYMRASVGDRLELIRGLMDTDGYQTATTNHSSYCTVSPQLASDFMEVVRSLGGWASVKTKETTGRLAYNVTVKMNDCPFWVQRKADRWQPRTSNPIVRSIDSIEPAGRGPATCITVDAEDSLFVTEDYLVTHNSFSASLILAYAIHWCLCLNDPQAHLGLATGSQIEFGLMSSTEKKAKGILFEDLRARMDNSPWFQDPAFPERLPNPKTKSEMIWDDRSLRIAPGTSKEVSFEGLNILGAIIDEIDSHTITADKDYGRDGYNTIYNRCESRYEDRGFVVAIGQTKSQGGFAQQLWNEFTERGHFTHRLSKWEARGWDYYRDRKGPMGGLDEHGEPKHFYYDVQRHEIIPSQVVQWGQREADHENLLKIPMLFKEQYLNNGPKALKDTAGIPPLVGDPFIHSPLKVELCRERWLEMFPGRATPVLPDGRLDPSFRAPNSIPRVMHIDIGLSGDGDALGMAMGHVSGVREVDGELKPQIVFDFIKQWTVEPGRHLELTDVRHMIYHLKDDLKFKIAMVTADDRVMTADFMQQLQRRRIPTDYLSVDKSYAPYYDLREAIYEDRVAWPHYMVPSRRHLGEEVEIAFSELTQLVDDGKKVDHTSSSTKDVADAMAGVVHTLMMNRTYHRRGGHTPVEVKPQHRGSSWRQHFSYAGGSGRDHAAPPTAGMGNSWSISRGL